jgi:hypothetical protein
VIRFPLSADVREATFFASHADNVTVSVLHRCNPCFMKTEYPVGLMINLS